MSNSPQNIVHITPGNIAEGRIKHITQNEIEELAATVQALSAVSFANSTIVSAATSLTTYLTFVYNGETYALSLNRV
jgi:hypothetical protein